jgi:Ca-activated chloride channel homolog
MDSKQLYPVGRVDRTEAKTAVATLRPTGWFRPRCTDQDEGREGESGV